MAVNGDREQVKRLKDMKIGEKLFVSDTALLGDLNGRLYVCANLWASDFSERADTVVDRYGKGIGEFNFTCGKRPIEIKMYEDPIYNPSELYDAFSDDGVLIVPMGFTGDVTDYVKKFFPGGFEDYEESITEYEEYRRDMLNGDTEPVEEVPLKSRFPKTYGLRKRLGDLAKTDNISRSNFSELIQKCKDAGEGLSTEELRRIFSL